MGGTAGTVTCCHPTPEDESKTLGHIPPTQGLWSIWGGQETLGQGGTLISERIRIDDAFSWGTLPHTEPQLQTNLLADSPGQGPSLFQPQVRDDVFCSVGLV